MELSYDSGKGFFFDNKVIQVLTNYFIILKCNYFCVKLTEIVHLS